MTYFGHGISTYLVCVIELYIRLFCIVFSLFSATHERKNLLMCVNNLMVVWDLILLVEQAILVGQVGQTPIQKRLKSGHTVTLLSLGTGGIRNNRRPLDNEEPRDYANRSVVLWHGVSVYPERLGELAMENLLPG